MKNSPMTAAALATLATELNLPTSREEWDGGFTRSIDARVGIRQDGRTVWGTIAYITPGGHWAGVRIDDENCVHEWPPTSLVTIR